MTTEEEQDQTEEEESKESDTGLQSSAELISDYSTRRLVLLLAFLVIFFGLNSALFFVLVYLLGFTVAFVLAGLGIAFAIWGKKANDDFRYWLGFVFALSGMASVVFFNQLYTYNFCTDHEWLSSESVSEYSDAQTLHKGNLPYDGEAPLTLPHPDALGIDLVLRPQQILIRSGKGDKVLWTQSNFASVEDIRLVSKKNSIYITYNLGDASDRLLAQEVHYLTGDSETFYLVCGPKTLF